MLEHGVLYEDFTKAGSIRLILSYPRFKAFYSRTGPLGSYGFIGTVYEGFVLDSVLAFR